MKLLVELDVVPKDDGRLSPGLAALIAQNAQDTLADVTKNDAEIDWRVTAVRLARIMEA